MVNAPNRVRELMAETFDSPEKILHFDEDAKKLAEAYLKQKVVPPKYADDARHVAISVIHRLDLVVSWNFKHMVNVHRNDQFNAVNLLQGYPPVRIVSPMELIYGEEEV